MKPKHVLVYCPVFLPEQSGYSHAFEQLVRNLLAHEVKVDIVTPQLLGEGVEEPLQHSLLRVFRYNPKLAIWGIGMLYSAGKRAGFINNLTDTYQYDLVWVETGDDPLLLASLSRKTLDKTVVRFHATSDTEYLFLSKAKKYRIRKFIWRNLSAYNIKYVCATNTYHLQFALHYLLKSASVKASGVCINAIEHVESNRPQQVLAKPREFIMLGRMDPEGYKQKGFDLLLDALPMVNEVAIKTNSKLTVIGSGALASTFKKQISPYNWVQYFEQIPHQQVKLKLKQSDVVLMPSRYEGLSVFALEGLQEGLAFVLSDAGALRDLWSNNGWLVSPLNAQTLGDAMIAAMNDTSLQSKQHQSSQLAQQAFTQTIQWQQFLTIWEAITNG